MWTIYHNLLDRRCLLVNTLSNAQWIESNPKDGCFTVKPTIRRATPDDLQWIVTELADFQSEIPTQVPFYSPIHTPPAVSELIDNHIVLIAETPLERIGFIAGYATRHPFNPEIRVLYQSLWWVKRLHRKVSRAAVLLLDAFVAWGKANVDRISFGLQSITEVSDRALIKRGFQTMERTYHLEVI